MNRACAVRSLLIAFGCLCAVACSPAAGATSAAAAVRDGDPGWGARLDGVVEGAALRGARVAALVVRERDGRVLYGRDADRALIPASNTKLLTGLAALATFGPTHQFETRIRSDRPPDASGSVGTLLVRGGGDPVMNSEDWWRLAEELRRIGLRRVTGDLVLDDSAFDSQRWNPAWGKVGSRAYHAPIGALAANYGSFAVTVRPGAGEGEPAVVDVSPPVSYLRVVNRARTLATGRKGLRVTRRPVAGADEVIVEGSLRPGDPEIVFYRSVSDPTRYAGSVLRHQLSAVGIQVDGKTRVGPAEARFELLDFGGRPLSQIVRLLMKYSNNMIAESLLKGLALDAAGRAGSNGAPHAASWQDGVRAMRSTLLGLGIDPEGFSLVDGSGLAVANRITPRTLVGALRVARASFDFGPELVVSLPIGNRDGTLDKRAREAASRVRAKTGLLDGVTGLSGLAQLADGETALFSILVNGYRVTDSQAMRAVDAFVAELVSRRP